MCAAGTAGQCDVQRVALSKRNSLLLGQKRLKLKYAKCLVKNLDRLDQCDVMYKKHPTKNRHCLSIILLASATLQELYSS